MTHEDTLRWTLTDIEALKYVGPNVKIHRMAMIVCPEVVEVGEGTRISDFAFINGGAGSIRIGRFNTISPFVSITGGGRLISADYVGIAVGARVITGTHHYGSGKRISPLISEEGRCVIRGTTVLHNDVFIGANAIVHPNVVIGEGAIIGSGGLVLRDVAPWTINVGVPVRVIGQRPKIIKEE